MTHILHLDASPRGDRSVSRTLSTIDFVHADSLALGDDARNLAIANAQSALKTAVAQG